MKIRGKTLSVIAFALLATALANFFVLKTLVFPTFLALEQQAAARDLQRVIEAINSETEDVDKTLWDYSSWDDSYRYAKGGYKSYPDGNLAIETLRNLRLDVVEVYDIKRTKLFAVVYDRVQDRIRRAPWTLARSDHDDRVLSRVGAGENVVGIISTPDGPAMFAARPIVKTNGEGPSAGTFIFGRFLDDKLIATIKDKIKVDFSLTSVEKLSGSAADAYRQLLASGNPVLTEEAGDDRLIAYALLRDVGDQPILLATANARRDISQIGRRVLIASVGGVAATAILVMAVLAGLLQWVLVGPLVQLTQHVVEIGDDDALGRRIGLKRRDEIGILGREFDRMLASLAEARDRLLDHTYQSGIAHMASGILHNLRNQLMPPMTRLERLREQVADRGKQQIDAALEQLNSEQTPPERKAKIAAYIALSIQDARERQKGVAEELSAVSRDLVRVEDVLGELDRFSRVHTTISAVSLAACVEEALAAIPSFPDVTVDIQVDPQLASEAPVASSSFILRHVLQNLIINAIEAIGATGRSQGSIKIKAEQKRTDNENYVDLMITDDGIGIMPENISEIFKRGVTTKKAQRGTGLHWCANSISAMSGLIFAESAGENTGSTFHVVLHVADVALRAA
ncbi:MAG: CHASE4 domain-containing protein [Rhodospirillales bacterium]